MIGTKELLEKQKHVHEPAKVEIAPLESGLTLEWDIPGIAQGFGVDHKALWQTLYTPGVILALTASWLGAHGFAVQRQGRKEYLAMSENNYARYRIRLAVHHLEFTSPSSAQEGWLVLFQCDLPKAPLYFISNRFVDQMCNQVNSREPTDRHKLKAIVGREYIHAALQEDACTM